MKYIIIILMLFQMLLFVGCEDDAILEPGSIDGCTGSYCSLTLPGSNNKSTHENPKVF